MASILILVSLVLLVAAATGVTRRLIDNDGGPRSTPMEATGAHWHPGLPTHPYLIEH